MKLLLILIPLFVQQFTLPASREYIVQNYTIEDGLPVNSVNRMTQDTDGYIYFATSDGLARFDGHEFDIYNSGNTPGLASNRISDMIYIPDTDELWLLHSTGSLTRKTGSNFETHRAAKGSDSYRTVQMTAAENGEFWIATEGGVATFDRPSGTFQFHNHLILQKNARAVSRPDSQTLLSLTDEGLIRTRSGKASILLPSRDFPIPIESANVIRQIEDTIWIAGETGAFRYSESDGQTDVEFILEESNRYVWDVQPYDEKRILINSSAGFYLYSKETGSITLIGESFVASTVRTNLVYQGMSGEEILIGADNVWMNGERVLSTEDIISAFLDSSGSLWVSTLYYGVFQVRKSSISNITPEQIPEFENIYPVIESADGSIWAGSFHNGVFRLTENGHQNWNPTNSNLPVYNARFLFEDSDGTIYAGMRENGLWTFSNGFWQEAEGLSQLLNTNVTVMSMHQNDDGLIIGTTDRMAQLNDGRFSIFDNFGFGDPDSLRLIRVVRESANGTLFTGSFGYGLSIIKGDSVQTFTTENSGLLSNYIRDIFVESDQTLWIATEDRGLNRVRLNAEGKPTEFKQITTLDGLIHNSLHRIIKAPGDRLWISSNGGIMSIPLHHLNQYTDGELGYLSVLALDEKDGMVNREANGGVQSAGILTRNHNIYFPNQRGLTVLDLQDFSNTRPSDPPRLLIEQVSFTDSTLTLDDVSLVELPSGKRNVRIEFTAPQFTSPENIQFRYRLDGVNSEWEAANEAREAVFTNIPPGRHTFLLSAYEIGSEQAVSEASLDLYIPYYFYETAWFKIFMVLGLIGFIYAGIRYRTRYLKQREEQLQQLVDAQTKQLRKAAEQKSRFFSGITHELKTPLALISGPLEDLLQDGDNINRKKRAERLQLMKRNSDRLQNLVSQILDVTKLNSEALKLTHKPIDIVEQSRQIAGQFQSALDQKEITLHIESDPLDDKIYADPEAWERILINLLSNAIRFSPRDSKILLKIKDSKDVVEVIIQDEGFGMDQKDADRVFDYLYQADGAQAAEGTGIGLYIVKGLTEHMGGTVSLQTRRGLGSVFTITLRKGFEHIKDSDTVLHSSHRPAQNTKITETVHHPKLNRNGHGRERAAILIVEDNDDFRSYLQSVLSDTYEVATAREGNEALEILKTTNPDLILSDVMMPGMDGFQFVQNIREIEQFRHLPVLFLSAKDLDKDKEQGLSTGADVYLTKPVKSKLLRSQIAALLRRERLIQGNQLHNASDDEDELVTDVREIVYRHLANPDLTVEMLADFLYVSRSKLYADWKEVCDTSLNAFIKEIRLDEAKKLITEHGFSVQETAAAVGFPDPNYFSTSFKKEFGVSPSRIND